MEDVIAKCFSGYKMMHILPKDTIPHILTACGAKMISIEFGVKRSNKLEDEILKWVFVGFFFFWGGDYKVLFFSHRVLVIESPHHTRTTNGMTFSIPIDFGVKRSCVLHI
jgi:hypothetical protein